MTLDRLEQRHQTIVEQLDQIKVRLGEITAAIDEVGIVVTGSRGQPVTNKLLFAERILRRDQAALERELIPLEQQLEEHRRVQRVNAIFAAAKA